MDSDAIGGIVLCAFGVVIAAGCVWGLVTAPARLKRRGRPPMTRGAVVMTVLVAVAFAGGGIGMLFYLTLSGRVTRVLRVEQKFYRSGTGRISGQYEVVTNLGTFEASGSGTYDGLLVGRTYRCKVRATGYTGSYSVIKEQSALESCQPAG